MRAKSAISVTVLLFVVGAAVPLAGAFHFGLSGSAPAADSAVPSPEQLRLWFTQVPQENSVAIRLIDGAGNALETGEPERSEEDDKVFAVSVGRTLPGGAYTVTWRGIGDDGHVVRGDFGFTVSAQ